MENQDKQGTCKFCGQVTLIGNADLTNVPDMTNADDIASYVCECEAGDEWREAKEAEKCNQEFIDFANGGAADFMRENDLKRLTVRDNYGNKADLLRMEAGETRIDVTTKTIVR